MDARPLQVAIVRARYNPYGGAERFVQRALAALAAAIRRAPSCLPVGKRHSVALHWSLDTPETKAACIAAFII